MVQVHNIFYDNVENRTNTHNMRTNTRKGDSPITLDRPLHHRTEE